MLSRQVIFFNQCRHKDFLIKAQTKAIMTNELLRRMNIHSCWEDSQHSLDASYILLVGGTVQLCGFFIDIFAHKNLSTDDISVLKPLPLLHLGLFVP